MACASQNPRTAAPSFAASSADITTAGPVQADVVLVMLLVNAEVIRKNPVGAGLGPFLREIPPWDEFMSGTDIDPVRDTDWFIISGPSLVHTERDVVLIHYSAPDTVVDGALDSVRRKRRSRRSDRLGRAWS
jgi:hypothetical protein